MEDFFHHRQCGKEILVESEEKDDNNMRSQARFHFMCALEIAALSLRSVLIASSVNLSAVKPMFDSAIEIHKSIESLNYALCILFDEKFAELELILFAFRRMVVQMESSSNSIPGSVVEEEANYSHQCAACSSGIELEEDVDNPGTFYCLKCWKSYDYDNGVSDDDDGGGGDEITFEPRAGLYTIDQLKAIGESPMSQKDALRPLELGFHDEASLNSMLQSLPGAVVRSDTRKKSNNSKSKRDKRQSKQTNTNATVQIPIITDVIPATGEDQLTNLNDVNFNEEVDIVDEKSRDATATTIDMMTS
jgi:hypothetical protein